MDVYVLTHSSVRSHNVKEFVILKLSFNEKYFWTRRKFWKLQCVFVLHHSLLSEKIKGILISHDMTLLKFGKVS